MFANTEINLEQIQMFIFKNSLQAGASECFDCEMCSLNTMNELNHVDARLHSWAWSTAAADGWAAATGRNHHRSSRCLQSAHMLMHKHMQAHSLKKKKKTTFPKHPSIHFLMPFPAAEDSCQRRGTPWTTSVPQQLSFITQ